MLPQIFSNNLIEPLLNLMTPPRSYPSPFISSLGFQDNFRDNTYNMEVVSNNQFGEDAIYVLPQLP